MTCKCKNITMTIHALVWLDHQEARVLHVAADTFDAAKISSPRHHVHRHPKGTAAKAEHPDDAQRFFHQIVEALQDADQILIVGPGTAKLELVKHVHLHDQRLVPRVVGVETVDHPSDGQLVAYGRKYFLVTDQMRAVAPLT